MKLKQSDIASNAVLFQLHIAVIALRQIGGYPAQITADLERDLIFGPVREGGPSSPTPLWQRNDRLHPSWEKSPIGKTPEIYGSDVSLISIDLVTAGERLRTHIMQTFPGKKPAKSRQRGVAKAFKRQKVMTERGKK